MTMTPPLSRALPTARALAIPAGAGMLLLALSLAPAAEAATPAPPAPAAASAPANSVRPEIAIPLNLAQEKIRAGAFADALAQVRQAEQVGNFTPFESYVLTRLRAQAAFGTGDLPQAIKDFDATLASPLLPPADHLPMTEALIKVLYNGKEYARAVALLATYQKEGGKDPVVLGLVPSALYLAGDYAGAAAAMSAQVNAQVAAGTRPTEKDLRLLASAQINAKDDAGYVATLERLAEGYPKIDYWTELVARAAGAETLADRLHLDALRLQQATIGHKNGSVRLQHAYFALRAGYPAEAKPLIDDGLAQKLFSATDTTEATKLRDQVNKVLAQDKAAAAANESSAKAAKDGEDLVNLGLELVFDGQAEKGLALMDQGVAKGGLKRPDDARLHLGVAQFRAGKLDDARKTFETVQGNDGTASLARLWGLFAKIGGKL